MMGQISEPCWLVMPKPHCVESSAERAQIDHSTGFVFIWGIIHGHFGNNNDNDNQIE